MTATMQNRNVTIDMLKFLAVIFITNSHFDEQYVYAKVLATGGAIGDALFFFCSGYTLFLGRDGGFDTWYKRRLRRILPSVLALVLVYGFFESQLGLLSLLYYGANWFVPCILICYVPLYFIRKYAKNRLIWVYAITGILIVSWYSLFFEPFYTWFLTNYPSFDWMLFCTPMDKVWMYQWNYFKWLFFFLFMLLGAQMGFQPQRTMNSSHFTKTQSFGLLLGKLMGCLIAFYSIPLLIERMPEMKALLILTLLPLIGICYYFYKLAETVIVQKLYAKKYIGAVVSVIGGLCLEIYLIQPFVRTTALNFLFPLNLVILFLAIVLAAYLLRCLSRFFQQTFSSEDGYDWRQIVNLK